MNNDLKSVVYGDRSCNLSYSTGEADAYYDILRGCYMHWKKIGEVIEYCETQIQRCKKEIEISKSEHDIWLQLKESGD